MKQRTFKKVEVAGNHAVNTAILTVVLSLSLINFSPVLVFLIAQDHHQDYLRIHNYTAKPYICLAFKTKKSLLRRNWNQFQRTDETTEKKNLAQYSRLFSRSSPLEASSAKRL